MTRVTAVLLAGSRPGKDPFAASHGVDLKALIPVAGQAMVRRPATVLLQSAWIGKLIVVAQQPDRIGSVLPEDDRIELRSSASTIAATLEAICDDPDVAWPVLVTTADHVLLSEGMIDEICALSDRCEIAIGLVERKLLMRRFPDASRTWLKFKGGAYSGANLFLLNSPKAMSAIALWRSVEQDRKKGLRLLWSLGPGLFLRAALRTITLDHVLARLSKRLGLRLCAVRMSDPLAAVDVDKPQDHELVEAILEGRR